MSDPIVLERLRRGAEILGERFRAGERCTAGWTLRGKCACQKRSKFCVARQQWIQLMAERDILNPERKLGKSGDDSPFGIVESMVASELAATGLTITTDSGVKIGPAGNVGCKLSSEIAGGQEEGGEALAMLLRTFKGSKVTKVERPAAV